MQLTNSCVPRTFYTVYVLNNDIFSNKAGSMGNAEDFTKEFMKDMFGGSGGGKGQPMPQQPPPMQQQQQQQQQQFQQQPMQQQQQSYNSPQGLYSEDAIKKEAARG